MRFRFLQTTESQTPGFPFQPGQEIVLAEMTSEAQRWVKYHHAIVLPDEPERAVVPTPAVQHAVQQAVSLPPVRTHRGRK